METIKKVVPFTGLKKDESGQEPVSGVEGQGTSTEPYDAGNQEEQPELSGKAPEHTDSKEEAPAPAPDTSAAEKTAPSQPADSKSDQPAEATANGTSGDAKSSPKLIKKPTIGSSSWFTNANPFTKGSTDSDAAGDQSVDPKTPAVEKTQAEAGGEVSKTTDKSELPPNHLGEDVPPGLDTVVVDPTENANHATDPAFASDNSELPNHLDENVPPGQLAAPMGKGKGKAKMTDADYAEYDSSSAASNRSTGTRNESVATDYTITSKNTYSTAGTGASTLASRRQSAVQAPHSQGKTITAGGIPLGQRAMLERERRLSSIIPERDFGRIDDITSSNTQRNSVVGFSDAGPSLSKHQDFTPSTRAPASSSSKTDEPVKDARVASVDSKTASPADTRSSRGHSSVIDKAKGLGRRFSQRIKPSK